MSLENVIEKRYFYANKAYNITEKNLTNNLCWGKKEEIK
jgi:hypothetical protein